MSKKKEKKVTMLKNLENIFKKQLRHANDFLNCDMPKVDEEKKEDFR